MQEYFERKQEFENRINTQKGKNIEIKVEGMHAGLPEHIVAKIVSTGKYMWVAMIDYTSKAAIKYSPIIGIFSDYDNALKAAKLYLENLSDTEFKETQVIVEAFEINKDYYQHYSYYETKEGY